MLGLAQKRFREEGGILPKTTSHRHARWPMLETLLQKDALNYVDYALAEKLHKENPQIDENIAVLICHLSIAARAGHLCCRIDAESIYPDVQSLWISEDLTPVSLGEVAILTSSIQRGAAQIQSLDIPICRLGSLYYLKRYWEDETCIIDKLSAITQAVPTLPLDQHRLSDYLLELQQSSKLSHEQSKAIQLAASTCLTLICGGPGTGKTYTAGQMIKGFWQAMTADQRGKVEIVLAAPTGKAAANLQQSLSRAIDGLEGFAAIKATTLHTLLGIRPNSRNRESALLNADLVLVDESSMIDVRVMRELLCSIKPGARLILLGDPHQLPPVSAGMLFADLQASGAVNAISLTKCLRTDLQGIVDFAQAIKSGNSHAVMQQAKEGRCGIRWHPLQENAKTDQQALVRHALPFFAINPKQDLRAILEAFNRFRILSPLRKGPLGVDAINELLYRTVLQEVKHEPLLITPILLTSSNHSLELFNGEVGILVRQMPVGADSVLKEGDYAIFSSRENAHEIRKVPALYLPKYEHAYCLSVHKSQGSEFDHVLLLMPERAEVFGREMLYTAATRARSQLEVWGHEEVVKAGVEQYSHRLSGLAQRMNF